MQGGVPQQVPVPLPEVVVLPGTGSLLRRPLQHDAYRLHLDTARAQRLPRPRRQVSYCPLREQCAFCDWPESLVVVLRDALKLRLMELDNSPWGARGKYNICRVSLVCGCSSCRTRLFLLNLSKYNSSRAFRLPYFSSTRHGFQFKKKRKM